MMRIQNADALLREFEEVLWQDVGRTLDRMRDKSGKVVLNADDLFKMLPRYQANPGERKVLGPLLYRVGRKFTDEIYQKLLSRPVDADDTIVLTAGGSATGKSTILRTEGRRRGVEFILDTTFSDTARGLLQVKEALDAGRKVEIHYVYRRFAASVKAMLLRALDPESGRIVPIDDMAKTHFGAQRAVLAVLAEYQNDERVSVVLKENGSDRKLRVLTEKEFARRIHPSLDRLREVGQNILDEFFRKERAKRHRDCDDQDSRGKNLFVSQDFYEAARSKTQTGGASPNEGDA